MAKDYKDINIHFYTIIRQPDMLCDEISDILKKFANKLETENLLKYETSDDVYRIQLIKINNDYIFGQLCKEHDFYNFIHIRDSNTMETKTIDNKDLFETYTIFYICVKTNRVLIAANNNISNANHILSQCIMKNCVSCKIAIIPFKIKNAEKYIKEYFESITLYSYDLDLNKDKPIFDYDKTYIEGVNMNIKFKQNSMNTQKFMEKFDSSKKGLKITGKDNDNKKIILNLINLEFTKTKSIQIKKEESDHFEAVFDSLVKLNEQFEYNPDIFDS